MAKLKGRLIARPGDVECPRCHRWFSAMGIKDHYRATHSKPDRKRLRKMAKERLHA